MLLLTNADVASAVTMDMVLTRLRQLYDEVGNGTSVSTSRADLHHPRARTSSSGEPAAHYLKTMTGGFVGGEVAALRLSSDLVRWTRVDGAVRRVKDPVRPGRWVGLVLLFSLRNGEPLGILQDGYLQRMRVGATNAIADDLLARADAERVGVVGSGGQARRHLEATALVREIREVRVWSPHAESRQRFADEMGSTLNVDVEPVGSAQLATRDADIVMTATNSREPVVSSNVVRPGLHLSTLQRSELDPDVYPLLDRMAVHTHQVDGGASSVSLVGVDGSTLRDHYSTGLDAARFPTLGDLVVRRAGGRGSPDEVTCFVNNVGLGAQFAAVGELALTACREKGLGRELDTEWFLEDLHP